MAPRPVRQKYWPDSSALRHGVHDGALTCALRNSTPDRAIRSKFGVRTTSLIPPWPPTSAWMRAYRPQSSANRNRMFGRSPNAAGDAALSKKSTSKGTGLPASARGRKNGLVRDLVYIMCLEECQTVRGILPVAASRNLGSFGRFTSSFPIPLSIFSIRQPTPGSFWGPSSYHRLCR